MPVRCAATLAGHFIDRWFETERRLRRADLYAECERRGVLPRCLDAWVSRYTTVEASGLSTVAARELPLGRRVVVEVTPAPDAPIAGELRTRFGRAVGETRDPSLSG